MADKKPAAPKKEKPVKREDPAPEPAPEPDPEPPAYQGHDRR